jgi:hypothetical protein
MLSMLRLSVDRFTIRVDPEIITTLIARALHGDTNHRDKAYCPLGSALHCLPLVIMIDLTTKRKRALCVTFKNSRISISSFAPKNVENSILFSLCPEAVQEAD